MDAASLGTKIKTAREAKGWTQEYLAEVVDLSPTHISVLERGVKPPRTETLVNIANALGVTADYLLMDSLDATSAVASAELENLLSGVTPKERQKILNIVRIMVEK